jgi:hypothetical protein
MEMASAAAVHNRSLGNFDFKRLALHQGELGFYILEII